MSHFNLRPYQTQCIDDLLVRFREYSRLLAVLPTGAGKTIVFAALAHRLQPVRTLVLAHRDELIRQAADKIARSTGLVAEVEKAEETAGMDAPVVVASVQTLARERRLHRWPRGHFGLVVVDEAHHILADSYQNVLGHFDGSAKVLGVTTITTEPDEAALELIDRLANEYQINIAIHNHPAPSHYWSPDVVLKAIEGRSKRIGACADTGHWVRSGLDPLECLKKLEGRILWSHFKDLKEKKKDSHDVPWGTGVSNAKALLVEMHRQGLKGCIIVEYEHNWENSMPEIAQCAAFFQKVMSEICPAKKAVE